MPEQNRTPIFESDWNENVSFYQGDILQSEDKHVVFGVNSEGHNDAGFAGLVTGKYWPELANTGGNELGEVLSKEVPELGKTFHAIVCHALENGGWADAPEHVKTAMAKLGINTEEKISSVLIGGGFVGQILESNSEAIVDAMKESGHKIDIYTL